MGRPRGKTKKLNDESDQDGGEEVSVSPTPTPTPPKTKRRRGRPAHKPLTDDSTDDVEAEEAKDAAGEVEEEEEDADGGGAKPAPAVRPAGSVDADAKGSTAAEATGGGKKRPRRRARVKRRSDDYTVGEVVGQVRSKSTGFRPNGSRRKSTPRRAAEAGVECK